MSKSLLGTKLLKLALGSMPERKLFCPIPFKQMEIMVGGATNLCCYVHKSPGTIADNNLADIYNSRAAQSIRASILDGTFQYCNLEACPHFAAGDLPLQKDCFGTRYENSIKEGTTAFPAMNIWLSFDSRCNLRCISCRKDHVRYSEEEKRQVERLLDAVRANLSHINNLGLCGNGDPFASPSMREFLFTLDGSKYPNLSVTLLTNGQLFNEQAWESMIKIQRSIRSIQVSMDAATKHSYESIRLGGSYDTLMKNLAFISGLRKQNLIGEFIISFVANSRNFVEMADFVKFGLDLGCDIIYFSSMMNWGVLSTKEYEDLAIHLPDNRQHEQFLEMLKNKIFDDPKVMMGNLSRFRPNRFLRDSMFS